MPCPNFLTSCPPEPAVAVPSTASLARSWRSLPVVGRRAITPATIGEANEVPSTSEMPPAGVIAGTWSPGAATSTLP
jgi:hypothetical protein